ncbi:hypothetical protein J437_LFUL018325 [Ladona fulva]|uniref:PDZ domain-containing protein n=1 Tax=Ladona fulva TaxID=123851 RepID=A0A8K0P0T7_LADFU|nr:hypothetical protein J437_LFUL018325 [Ladona fulva]
MTEISLMTSLSLTAESYSKKQLAITTEMECCHPLSLSPASNLFTCVLRQLDLRCRQFQCCGYHENRHSMETEKKSRLQTLSLDMKLRYSVACQLNMAEEVKEVELRRSDSCGLGFSILGGAGSELPPIIYDIIENSPAAECGEIFVSIRNFSLRCICRDRHY